MGTMKKIELIATKRVLADLDKIDVSRYEKVKTPEWESSDEHKTLLHEIFEKAKQMEKLAAIKLKRLRTSLIAAILVIATLITTVACVEPVRNFFEEITEKFISLTPNDGAYQKSTIEEIYLPKLLPETAVNIQQNVNEFGVTTVWIDGEDMVMLRQLPLEGSNIDLDIENNDFSRKNVAGMDVYYTLKYSSYGIMFCKDGYSFTLSCPERYTWNDVKKIIKSFGHIN